MAKTISLLFPPTVVDNMVGLCTFIAAKPNMGLRSPIQILHFINNHNNLLKKKTLNPLLLVLLTKKKATRGDIKD